jgi:SnoaL-like protein
MTDTTTATDLTAVVDAYVAAWNETDADRRAALVEQAWAPDGAYVDPMFAATGHADISEMHAGAHAQFPGHTIVRTSGLDAHHQLVRFDWELRDPDGATVVAGLDVAIVAEDGRLARLGGFFGPLPPVDA